jgi:hypothetical protein
MLGWEVLIYLKNILYQSSSYNIEDSSSSEMLVDTHQIAWHRIMLRHAISQHFVTSIPLIIPVMYDVPCQISLISPTLTDPFILPVAISGNHSMFNT